MATLVSNGNALFKASSWAVAEAGTNAIQTTKTTQTLTTTTPVSGSTTFIITSGNTVSGVVMHCHRINTTGTVTVGLSDGTTTVRTVTVNASDLPLNPSWVKFTFGSTYTSASAASIFRINIQGSSAGNAAFYGNSTNWARILPTTTLAAIVAGDSLYVVGSLTAAGASSANVITMNQISSSVTNTAKVDIGYLGTMTFGVSAAANWTLTQTAGLDVWDGGVLTMGTSAMFPTFPNNWALNFNNSVAGDFGLIINDGGTFTSHGSPKTRFATLSAPLSAGDTFASLDQVPTGWYANDIMFFTPTSRTSIHYDSKPLGSGNPLASSIVTYSGGVTYNHEGGPGHLGCEVVNLTNTIIIRTNAGPGTVVRFFGLSNVSCYYTNFQGLASTSRAVDVRTAAGGSLTLNGCYFFSNTAGAFDINTTSPANILIDGCVFSTAIGASNFNISTPTSFSNVIIRNSHSLSETGSVSTSQHGFRLTGTTPTGLTFENNRAYGCGGAGFSLSIPNLVVNGAIARSNNFGGITIDREGVTLVNWKSHRNSSTGLRFLNGGSAIISAGEYHGNAQPLELLGHTDTYVSKVTGDGGYSSFVTTSIVSLNDCNNILFENCRFGLTSAPSNSVIGEPANASRNILFVNCGFQTETSWNNSSTQGTAYLGSVNHNNIAGNVTLYMYGSRALTDFTIQTGGAPSVRFWPAFMSASTMTATPKLTILTIPVSAGHIPSVYASVRKSVVGDGGAYAGTQPQLCLRSAPHLGINQDIVVATMTGSTGAWEILSGSAPASTAVGVYEFYITSANNTNGLGWVNIDSVGCNNPYLPDFGTQKLWTKRGPLASVSRASLDNSGFKYWLNDGIPHTTSFEIPVILASGFRGFFFF